MGQFVSKETIRVGYFGKAAGYQWLEEAFDLKVDPKFRFELSHLGDELPNKLDEWHKKLEEHYSIAILDRVSLPVNFNTTVATHRPIFIDSAILPEDVKSYFDFEKSYVLRKLPQSFFLLARSNYSSQISLGFDSIIPFDEKEWVVEEIVSRVAMLEKLHDQMTWADIWITQWRVLFFGYIGLVITAIITIESQLSKFNNKGKLSGGVIAWLDQKTFLSQIFIMVLTFVPLLTLGCLFFKGLSRPK